MKISFKLLPLLSVLLLIGFVSCNKSKQLQRNLCSKGGKWNNTLYDYKFYDNGYLVDSKLYINAGHIKFDKKGTFSQVFIADTIMNGGTGTWSYTYKKMTLTVAGNTETYEMIEESKSKFRLELKKENGDYKRVVVATFEKEK